MLSRQQDPAWSFPTLFLFKDSLAVMMEAAGAWRLFALPLAAAPVIMTTLRDYGVEGGRGSAVVRLCHSLLLPAGLLDDALREYYELEAVYLESLQAGQLMKQVRAGHAVLCCAAQC